MHKSAVTSFRVVCRCV